MLNGLSMQGATVVQGRSENLHTSGHAYQVRDGSVDQEERSRDVLGGVFKEGGRRGAKG